MRRNKMSGLYELTEAELKSLLECRDAVYSAINVFEMAVKNRSQSEQIEFMERAYSRAKRHNFSL